MVTKTSIISDVKAFSKRVDAIGKQFNDRIGAVQALLVSALIFAAKDGNAMPCAYLFNGLGNAVNRESIGLWFAKYGVQVSYSSKERTYSARLIKEKMAETKAIYEADKDAAIASWLADTFTDIDKNKGRDFTGMNLDALIAAAVKRYEASKAKHKDDAGVKFDDGMLDYWKAGIERASKRNKPTTNADGAMLN